jgi:hypothetical protein
MKNFGFRILILFILCGLFFSFSYQKKKKIIKRSVVKSVRPVTSAVNPYYIIIDALQFAENSEKLVQH